MASQVGSYYNPAAAYGSFSAASMAAAAAAAQTTMSGLSAQAQVGHIIFVSLVVVVVSSHEGGGEFNFCLKGMRKNRRSL